MAIEQVKHDEDMSILQWLMAVSSEMDTKGVAVDEREVTLTGDEPRQLLVELADYKAEMGEGPSARILRGVILEGNPTSFIEQSNLTVGHLRIKAAQN